MNYSGPESSRRRGIGLRVGTTQREYDKRLKDYVETQEAQLVLRERGVSTRAQLTRAAQALGLGETEYRLNWIPLGGYVKMLGQDDLDPNSQSDDPRAFTSKSIPARMLVLSAGVIMNVILAAFGFMVVFLIGFSVPFPFRTGRSTRFICGYVPVLAQCVPGARGPSLAGRPAE
jgi:regulator of sigma E protease